MIHECVTIYTHILNSDRSKFPEMRKYHREDDLTGFRGLVSICLSSTQMGNVIWRLSENTDIWSEVEMHSQSILKNINSMKNQATGDKM